MKKLFTLMLLGSASFICAGDNKPAGCPSCSRSGYAINYQNEQKTIADNDIKKTMSPNANQRMSPDAMSNEDFMDDFSDADLTLIKNIDDALEPIKEFQNIAFDINDGAVVLTGIVDKQEDKTKAEDTVKKISGVKSVDNQITVKKK